EAIAPAMAQSFTSWGFTAWVVYGAISAIVIMYAYYNKGMTMRPRTLLYPIFGKRIEHSRIGVTVDVFCMLGVVAGTIGTFGFFGFQFSYWLHNVFGILVVLFTQVFAVGGLIIVVSISSVTCIDKGFEFFRRLNF